MDLSANFRKEFPSRNLRAKSQIMRFIADTDTDENYFGIHVLLQMQTQLFFAALKGGRIADQNCFGHNLIS